jgi:predicted XRE-type DNA-binding protein
MQVHSSSGNVFADLGLANPDELMLKAELVDRIDDLISARQLTETEAAELLGVDRHYQHKYAVNCQLFLQKACFGFLMHSVAM